MRRGLASTGRRSGASTRTGSSRKDGRRRRPSRPASAAWRTKIPGLGNSSPIVWGDLLCVTTAISSKDNSFKPGLYGNVEPVNDTSPHEWKVICLDKQTGAMRWEQTVHKGVPAVKRHPKSTQANATLATDGTHLVALFGSEGLHVYDLAGKQLWSKNFGVLDSGFFDGTGSAVGIRQPRRSFTTAS